MTERRVVIMGAAGRDFHVFNMVFRSNRETEIVAFTAAQIPGIESRVYPAELAGPAYPDGIPIVPEASLEALIAGRRIDEVVFAYSDVSHETVMHQASRVLAAGADFTLLGPASTMIHSNVPVVSVSADRTGAGKSQTSRFVARSLREKGARPVIVRHPMPYGVLVRQSVQRFESLEDLDLHEATVEEREDYEPHLRGGFVVYAGVDYEAVVREAEREADVIVWDGGNNDFPFVSPDLEITVVDPLRPGHESTYHPGEVNVRRATVVVVNKVNTASAAAVAAVRAEVGALNPRALIVEVSSVITLEQGGEQMIADLRLRSGGVGAGPHGLRVLVIEDGPTLTHGGMATGAGVEAARTLGGLELIDPRPYAVGQLATLFERYPHVGPVLPAVGYFDEQLRDLQATVAATPADVVLVATPFDLAKVIRMAQPVVRVFYELEERGAPTLSDVMDEFGRDFMGKV